MTEQEIGWVAGIIEADGCIFSARRQGRNPNQTTTTEFAIRVAMQDEDIINRLQSVTGVGNVRGPYLKEKATFSSETVMYEWYVCKRKDAVRLLLEVLHLLGQRRLSKADAFIGLVELADDIQRIKTETAKTQPCQIDACPDQYYAKGYCSKHYQSLIRRAT